MMALWLKGDWKITLDEDLFLYVPALFMQYSVAEHVIARLKEIGANAIVLGHQGVEKMTAKKIEWQRLTSLLKTLHAQQIKIILKPQFDWKEKTSCPLDPLFRLDCEKKLKQFNKIFPLCDFILWDSLLWHPNYFSHPASEECLTLDLVQQELKLVQESLAPKVKLIFSISSPDSLKAHKISTWFKKLLSLTNEHLLIAFPLVAGEMTADHQLLHPIWKKVKELEGAVPFMPLINGGAITQGEGLWPSIPFEQFETYSHLLNSCQLTNCLVLTPKIPVGQGFLALNLWVVSHLKKGLYVEELIAKWFDSYQAHFDYFLYKDFLQRVRQLILDLSFLRMTLTSHHYSVTLIEEMKILVESLHARMKHLQVQLKKLTLVWPSSFLQEYFLLFAIDAHKIINIAVKQFNLHFSLSLLEMDEQHSFWVLASSKLHQISNEELFLKQPFQGVKGSVLEKIRKENSWLEVELP